MPGDSLHTLASEVANLLRGSKDELVSRWLERISARVSLAPNKIFPTDDLLNHVPLLIEGIADFLERPDDPDDGTAMSAKAMELGALRHAQGFDAYQILKEYEILGGVVFSFLYEAVEEARLEAPRRDFLRCWQRVGQAIEVIRQATMTHFLRLSAEKVKEREEQLRKFNRTVSHELKNRVGAIRGAAHLLQEDWLEPPQRQRFQRMLLENSDSLQRAFLNLVSLSQIETDSRQRRNVLLPQAAAEVVRQLRDAARAASVQVELADDLPPVEVDAGAVELCLMNYISNSIKYSDKQAERRWVRIEGGFRFEDTSVTGGLSGELTVRVRDNGIGVPEKARSELFGEFFRAHAATVTGIEGSGLGLSIVRETVESLGGCAWAEFPAEGGSVFAFALPSRREEDAAAAGTRRPEGGK
ncbi:MAG: sensor histidine kinase [Gemmatimonadaceae bacterium]